MKRLTALALLICLLACEKDQLPEPSTASPVFEFNATIDGQQINLKGGVDNYYLFSSTTQDGNGVKSYIADLTKNDCVDCPNSLRITLIDYASSATSNTIADSTFYVGNYNLATSTGFPSRYSVQFTPTTLGPVLTGINWDFGDGKTILETSPNHTYTRPGKYEVCMNANFVGGCSSNLCNALELGNLGDFCEANLVVGPAVGTTFNFSGTGIGGQAPYTYFWDFGDGNTAVDQNMAHSYAAEGVYTARLTVRDANGLESTKRQNVRTQNSTDCAARYTYAITPIANPENLGNVVIEWRDANGVLYTSKNDNQPLRSYFRINSVEEYFANEDGKATKKLAVQFSCTLYNGMNQLEIKNATAVIAVAY